MYPRLRTTSISETLALVPDDAVAALEVHRFDGVLAGLWSVTKRTDRLTFIGVPTWRPYLEDMNSLVVPVRIVLGHGNLLADIVFVPWSDRATQVSLVLTEAASRRMARGFHAHVERLRALLQTFAAGLLDASTRTSEPHDLFADSELRVA